MELKRKTIIWEDNTEPPKNYIWVKKDGKAYEWDNSDRKWKESESIIVPSEDHGDEDQVIKNFITIDQNIMSPSARIGGDVRGSVIQEIRNNSHIYLGNYVNNKLQTIY